MTYKEWEPIALRVLVVIALLGLGAILGKGLLCPC